MAWVGNSRPVTSFSEVGEGRARSFKSRVIDASADKRGGLRHDLPAILYIEVPRDDFSRLHAESRATLLYIDLLSVRLDCQVNAVKSRHHRKHWALELDNACAGFQTEASLR